MLSTPKYELKLHQPISIILIGPSQIGKSTFVNKTFGMEIARVGENGKSCTSNVARYCKVVPGANVLFIVDTPGISDTYTPDNKIKELILKQLPVNSTTKEKCVFVFYKFYEEITGNATKSAIFAKEIRNHYKNNTVACNIILMLTYSGIDSLKTFPANWKKKKLENPEAIKIKDSKMLGAYLWEEMRKEKEEFFKKEIGVGSLEVLTVDFGPEEENGDVFVRIKTQDELNLTLGEKFPSLLPHMTFREETGISLSTAIGVAVGSGAAGVAGAALGISAVAVGGVVVAPIALLGLIAGWLSLSKSESIKVFLTHEHDFCRSMNGVMKFFDPSSQPNVDLLSAMWDLIPRDNSFYLRGQEGYVVLTKGKLSFSSMKSKKPDFDCIFVTNESKSGSNDHQMLLMMTDNTVKYYLVIEKNVLCVTNNIKLASNFTFMIADC